MHSLRGWKWVVLGSLVTSTRSAAVPAPIVTPAPEPGVEVWMKRQAIDVASFAQVLLTAIPLSLLQIAATNAPAVSSILWEEFLDEKKPQWFLDLPWDIQSYLIKEFGPETAWLSTPPQTTGVQTTPADTAWQSPQSTIASLSSQETISVSDSVFSSTIQSLASAASASVSGSPTLIVSSVVTVSTSSVYSASSQSATSRAVLSSSAATDPDSPPASSEGLTRRQKIGLGVGIPIGIFAAAVLLLGCCVLLRRRRNRKHVNGSEPPSSPGFIPRFAFQDKSTDHLEHRAPLNSNLHRSSQDLEITSWEDDGYDPFEPTTTGAGSMDASNRVKTFPPTVGAPRAMHDSQPSMAPVVHHTHSSNRARGRRTSYSSLHSVAELSEPDDEIESPVLGRQSTPLQRKRRPSLPMVLEMPASPRAATIKRKPVAQSPLGISPAAEAASQSLLRPAMTHGDHSSSSSSGLAISTNSSTTGAAYQSGATSPVSPISQSTPANPFSNDYSYVEDYGPEYQGGYLDYDDGLYGGNRSLDRYPDPSPPQKSPLRTEWPLRNLSMGRRNSSPMWDRVYER